MRALLISLALVDRAGAAENDEADAGKPTPAQPTGGRIEWVSTRRTRSRESWWPGGVPLGDETG
jgi:hypothetical protein